MLAPDVLLTYNQKVQQYCEGNDPYKLAVSNDPLPRSVEKDSPYTHESFRAFKTLEAFKLYESGWVQSIICKAITTGSIIVARVKHSYRVSLKPLKCWLALDKTGNILTGHCDCMAGLGEVCSHIGAVLFLLEEWTRVSQKIEHPVSRLQLLLGKIAQENSFIKITCGANTLIDFMKIG